MVTFKKAIEWLEEGKRIRRPSWEEDSYWVVGIDETIMWNEEKIAHIHLNQIKAKDFEIYLKENKLVKEILKRETKGLKINNKTRNKLIFSYDDVEGMLNEIAEKKENMK